MPKVKNTNAIFSVNNNTANCISTNNYATVDKLDETLADVEKQIKSVYSNHYKKIKDIKKNVDELSTQLDFINENMTNKISITNDWIRDYIDFQQNKETLKRYCKEYKIKYNGSETAYDVCYKLYENILKEKMYQIKAKLKELKEKDKSVYDLFNTTKECIAQLDGLEVRNHYNTKIELLRNIYDKYCRNGWK